MTKAVAQRQRQRTETADSGCKQQLQTTRMAAALWIMVASVEAARRMQRLRRKRRRRRQRRRQAVNQNCVLRQALSTDIICQLAKDADGPDGKMKNTRKFGFWEYVCRTRK